MPHARPLLILVPLLGLAACGEDQSPTAPDGSAVPTAPPLVAATAGHRTVTSLVDPGDGDCNTTQCTLREAINDSGSTEISFASGLSGAITLASPGNGGGVLVIDKALTITGPSGGITIRRRSTDPEFRILRVGTAGAVTLTNLALRGGKEIDRPGGGIANFGTLALANCTVAGNTAQHGGGIDTHGPLTLTKSAVLNNSAFRGGGIDIHNKAKVTLAQSTVARNDGGGIRNNGSTLALSNSQVLDNTGAGISAERGTSAVSDARVAGNTGGGTALVNGNFTLANSTIARNSAIRGAGIANFDGTFTVRNTTIVGNSATERGGGIYNTTGNPYGRGSAVLTLTNSTVTGNSAPLGGGVENSDKLGGASFRSINSTVVLNSAQNGGGGIHQRNGVENLNSVSLFNSLVARNSAPSGPDVLHELNGFDEGGIFASFSLIGDGTGSGLGNTDGNQVGNVSPNTSPIDPRIDALADNGGPTRTHALLSGSPAIDRAAASNCPATDQRGVSRPQGAGCDIGSYERE